MWVRRLEQAFWSAHSRNWDDSLADDHVVDHISELTAWLAGTVATGTVLVDLGCGTGNHSIALASHGLAVVGADLSPEMLERAWDKGTTRGVRISLVRVDLHDPLPFRDDSVGAAVSIYAAQTVGARAGIVHTYTAVELSEALDAAGFRQLDERATEHSTAVLASRISD